MGIRKNTALLMLREHRYRPITGSFLSIGRQIVRLDANEAKHLITAELGGVRPQHFIETDRQTRGSEDRPTISDRSFYSLFSDLTYSCLDISRYEGADVIWNLCEPIPQEMESRWDFIYDGGCLDNIFDPATAIKNMARLLKPGGRIMHIDRVSRIHHIYMAFALCWFHDYYAINNFADCKVYLALWDAPEGTWDLYHYNPMIGGRAETTFFGQDEQYDRQREAHAIVIAEKDARSTWDRSPVQFQYRDGGGFAPDPYRERTASFNASPRPLYAFGGAPPPQHPQYIPRGVVNAI